MCCAFMTSISSYLHIVSSRVRLSVLLTSTPSTYHAAWLIVGIYYLSQPSSLLSHGRKSGPRQEEDLAQQQCLELEPVSGSVNALSTAAGLLPTTNLIQSILTQCSPSRLPRTGVDAHVLRWEPRGPDDANARSPGLALHIPYLQDPVSPTQAGASRHSPR